jgi:hypothetical protein
LRIAPVNRGLASSAAGLSAAMSSSTGRSPVLSGMTRKYSPASTGESTRFVRETGAKVTTPPDSRSTRRAVPNFQPGGSFSVASNVMSSVCVTGG